MTSDHRDARVRVMIGAERIAHHADRSGYDQLASRVGSLIEADIVRRPMLPRWLPLRVADAACRRAGMDWYGRESLAMEFAAARRIATRAPDVVHLLWGDQGYRWTGHVRRLRGSAAPKLVATFHQPPDILERVGPPGHAIEQLDGVVALAADQVEHFRSSMPDDRVFLVPHGIDTGWWRPGDAPRSNTSCLVVGQWLRDVELLVDVARMLETLAPHVRIQVVGDGTDPRLAQLRGIDVLGRLTDDELRAAYQATGALLLPLIDSTANCALLEAMACGAPIVCTDVGGVRDYVTDECAALAARGNGATMAHALVAVLDDPARQRAMSLAARERAAAFDWDRVAGMMIDVYRAL